MWSPRRGAISEFTTQKNPLPRDYQMNTSNFRRRIWYTSENLRPPTQEDFDGSLSFDQDEYRGFNAYCPSWYHDVGVATPKFSSALKGGSLLTLLKVGRKFIGDQSSGIGGFINDRNPLSSFIQQEFSKTNNVSLHSRRKNTPLYEVPRVNREFKFFLCSEVDFYPGYVTSILFEAYLAGAVPIYLGDLGTDQSINRDALINFRDFSSVADLVRYVSNLKSDDYAKIYEQPLLIKEPSLSKIVDIILG